MADLFVAIIGNAPIALVLFYLVTEIKGMRGDIKMMRSKEECNERHGQSCERLNRVEDDVKHLYQTITGAKK